jgi:hypothetical protein
MHLSKITAAMTTFMILFGASAVVADHDVPGADWMPKDKVMQKLEQSGYTSVTGLHADDGYWEGKGVKNGKIMEFHVDPHSGVFTKEEPDH